jgi:hypothetical protein
MGILSEERSRAMQDLQDKNMRLYQINTELVERYRAKGVWDAVLQREPITQIRDVRDEALAQEYRDRIGAARDPASPQEAPKR